MAVKKSLGSWYLQTSGERLSQRGHANASYKSSSRPGTTMRTLLKTADQKTAKTAAKNNAV
jgi:hypothetical protein